MLASHLRILARKPAKGTYTQRRAITSKVYKNANEAVAEVKDGKTLYVPRPIAH